METNEITLTTIISFLQEPSSYPHQPAQVTLKQTHASILAIAPPFVYKVKKHVNLGFLNFTSLEQRKQNCEKEQKLNSRFCPDLYLGIVPISVNQNQLAFGTKGRIVDYALQMKQLAEGYFLDQLLGKNQVTTNLLEPVISTLKAFYEKHPAEDFILPYGTIEKVKNIVEDNLYNLGQQTSDLVPPVSLEAIQQFFSSFIEDNCSLFDRRVQERRIRDCHGDLHLEHIHIQDGQVHIYDCIEFNDQFRFIDIAADIAFLAMDFDFHGRPDFSAYLVSRLTELLKDPEMHLLMDFYKCYRACVRAKVESIASGELEVPIADRIKSQKKAKLYVSLALSYSLFGSSPVVLLVAGRSGSGKSTIAKSLAQLLGWEYVNSDIIRKKMSGLALHERPNSQTRRGLYSKAITDQVYELLLNTTTNRVCDYKSIIVDATFGQEKHRASFIQALSALSISYYFLEMQVADEILKERLYLRDKSSETVSDARLEDFDLLKQIYQEPSEVSPQHLLRINTDLPTDVTLANIINKLSHLNRFKRLEKH